MARFAPLIDISLLSLGDLSKTLVPSQVLHNLLLNQLAWIAPYTATMHQGQ